MKARRLAEITLSLAMACCLLSPSPISARAASHDYQGAEAAVIDSVIVAYLGAYAKDPTLRASSEYDKLGNEISDLLVLFDGLNSSEAMSVFAGLSRYYMGEEAGELYNCIARRKGPALEPYLRTALENKNECLGKFGSFAPKTNEHSVCMSEADYQTYIEDLISDLKKHPGCSAEDFGSWVPFKS